MRLTCVLTVDSSIAKASAISPFEKPRATSSRTSRSRGVRSSSRSVEDAAGAGCSAIRSITLRVTDGERRESPAATLDEAFRELTEPHRRELRLHCYRILGSMQDAEDLIQETLLAAWRGLEAFEGRVSARAWLYRLATNRCLNALRARSLSGDDDHARASPVR